jgi:hypothetical protein
MSVWTELLFLGGYTTRPDGLESVPVSDPVGSREVVKPLAAVTTQPSPVPVETPRGFRWLVGTS